MSNEKTAVERLNELIAEEVKNGLQYIHVTMNRNGDQEKIAQEILDILEADKKGLCTDWHDY